MVQVPGYIKNKMITKKGHWRPIKDKFATRSRGSILNLEKYMIMIHISKKRIKQNIPSP